MSDFWRLHGFDWMAGLSERETERLLSRSTSRECARGETIFEPASSARSVYLLEKGLVRIFRLSAQGSRVHSAMCGRAKCSASCRRSPTTRARASRRRSARRFVWRIPIPELRRLIDTVPLIALRVAEQMEKRFKRVESRVEGLALRDLRSRVCFMLLELAEDFGRQTDGEVLIDLPLNQHDLATLIGASRQSVNKCLRDLRETRRIAYRKRRFALLDPDGLRRETVPG